MARLRLLRCVVWLGAVTCLAGCGGSCKTPFAGFSIHSLTQDELHQAKGHVEPRDRKCNDE